MEKLEKVSNVLQLRLSAKETEETIRKLERAAIEHGKWINEFSRNLICNLPVQEKYLKRNSYKSCEFGGWYYEKSSKSLANYPGFVLLDQYHRNLHEESFMLANKAVKGEQITTIDFDRFIDNEQQLSISLLKLRDELYKLLYAFDPLTGLLTRQAFYIILSQEYARILRTDETSCVSMVDLDHFKKVNDTYGHQAGDYVLEAAAQYFSNELRPYDSISRYGGEEFLVCLPNTSRETAYKVLDRLRLGIANLPIQVSEHNSIKITASFGIAKMQKDVPLLKNISQADEALYAAKNGGRNKVHIWEEAEGGV